MTTLDEEYLVALLVVQVDRREYWIATSGRPASSNLGNLVDWISPCSTVHSWWHGGMMVRPAVCTLLMIHCFMTYRVQV